MGPDERPWGGTDGLGLCRWGGEGIALMPEGTLTDWAAVVVLLAGGAGTHPVAL